MQPFDTSSNSGANQGILQTNDDVTQSSPVISSNTQPPGVFDIQQAPQDNSNKMNQRDPFGKSCAMTLSFLSVIIGGVILYIIFHSDYWSAIQEIGDYASDLQDGGNMEDVDLGYLSNAADSCVTFATCIKICGFLVIGVMFYHGFISFVVLSDLTKEERCVIFLMIFEVGILIGSSVLASEIYNNDCNGLVSDLLQASESVLSDLGTNVPELEGFLELSDPATIFSLIFAILSFFTAVAFCWWNVNIRQAKRY